MKKYTHRKPNCTCYTCGRALISHTWVTCNECGTQFTSDTRSKKQIKDMKPKFQIPDERDCQYLGVNKDGLTLWG